VQQHLYQRYVSEKFRGLLSKFLSKYGLVNEGESWCYGKGAYSIWYALYPRRYRDKNNTTSYGYDRKPKMGRSLLVEMFHRGGTENNQETDPERSLLEGNCLIGLFITFFCLI